HEIKLIADVVEDLLEPGGGQQLSRIGGNRTGRKDRQSRGIGWLDRAGKVRLAGQNRAQAHGIRQTEMGMQARLSKVGIDQQGLLAELGKGKRQVSDEGCLAVA